MWYNEIMNTIFISADANVILKIYLREKGHHLIEIGRTPFVYDAIAAHPDIYLCKLKESIVISREQFPLIQPALGALQGQPAVHLGASSLGYNYPENIKYNGVQMGKYFIHHTRHTDPVLLQAAKEEGLEILHVKQGYSKCNLAVVDEESAITSDAGMAKVLQAKGLQVLLISPGHIILSGFPYGFLGGACGRAGQELIFHGDLSCHPDFKTIQDFVESRHITLKYFTQFPLTDIGSVIEVKKLVDINPIIEAKDW